MIALVPLSLSILLAGEPIQFDENVRPQFSDAQVRASNHLTRAGLITWAATSEGQRVIARFRAADVEITVTEDPEEMGPGRAPQPGIATLLAAGDRTRVKHYEVIVNPALAAEYGRHRGLAFGDPLTPIDVMAGAWAAEMLHVDFYARGIPLPHHDRADFQERWRAVASELGYPIMKHDTQ